MTFEQIMESLSLDNYGFFVDIAKLILCGVAVFFAIFTWSKNRESSWTAVIGGVLLLFARIIYAILYRLAFFDGTEFMLGDFPVLYVFFEISPFVLFVVAFVLKVFQNKG